MPYPQVYESPTYSIILSFGSSACKNSPSHVNSEIVVLPCSPSVLFCTVIACVAAFFPFGRLHITIVVSFPVTVITSLGFSFIGASTQTL